MPVTFRAVPQRRKVVDLASRQTNQKQIYHFLYSARHFLGCAGVRFSRSQDPEAYSSSAKRTFASEVRLSLSSQRRCVCTRAFGRTYLPPPHNSYVVRDENPNRHWSAWAGV